MAYNSEDEQIETIRRWWRENGRAVIIGVVIAVAAVLGWQQWRAYQARQALAASDAYQNVVAQVAAGDLKAAAGGVAELRDNYAGSPYATLASLRLAQARVEAGRLKDAEAALRWAVDNGDVAGFQVLARLRLGQVLLAQERLDEALETLEPVPEGAFAARYHELRGDVHAARADREAAIAAYRAALAGGLAAPRRALVEVKLSDLGAEVEPEPVS